jgi:RNA polymerase sigma factor (sigma-70 family)
VPDTPEEFDQFFRREFGALVAFVRKLGYDLEDSQDAAAEAMHDAYRHWARIEAPLAWIRVAAQRIALSQAQRRRRGFAGAVRIWAGSRENMTDQMADIDGKLRLLALLALLPDQQRVVIVWYLDGFSTNTIAQCLGISEATVRSTKRHALNLLRKRLDDLRRLSGEEGARYGS